MTEIKMDYEIYQEDLKKEDLKGYRRALRYINRWIRGEISTHTCMWIEYEAKDEFIALVKVLGRADELEEKFKETK